MYKEKSKKSTVKSPFVAPVKKILRKFHLHSVCESAHCPNIGDCFKNKTATFLILGDKCTRNCRFCNIEKAENISKPDPDEPENLANAVKELGLEYVVITSVTRDDMDDGGAHHFVQVVDKVKKLSPRTKVEVLTPDFLGSKKSLDLIASSGIDVFNHNMETVLSRYSVVRPEADYFRSLEVLLYMKRKGLITKSGFMVGVGETLPEIKELMKDMRDAGCDILTVGQYFQPTKKHLQVEKDYTPEEFLEIEKYGYYLGLKEVYSGRFVRSSFNAREIHSNYCKGENS
jgi:lipoyl synthase